MPAKTITQPTFIDRVASIDILRALTMVLMIFVNDLWSLTNIPAWLEHVENGVDGIGLADVVFPAFLFIVGLSIPLAIDHRRKKGDTNGQLVIHVLMRTVALLTMGLYLVNGESINEEATGIPRMIWNTIGCVCFILIWNSYPKTASRTAVYAAKALGIITLLFMAFIYRGGDHDGHITRFGIHWWGILGLIGWAYFAAGLITVFARNSLFVATGAWIVFAAMSMLSKADMIPSFLNFIPDSILGGTLAGLTMGGVVTSLIFQHYRKRNDHIMLTVVLGAIAGVLIVLSILTRPYWGLAKLGATPAWLFLCSAFTIIAFLMIYWIADVCGKARAFSLIRPAGTDTLLCYLLPYFAYTLTWLLHINLPAVMLNGPVGLLKSLAFAIGCAVVTGGLIRIGIRLKL